jgi:peptidoglycan/LPS O-acetylase OafA/YrhL
VIYFGWVENIAPGSWIFWSLAIEEHFYLVFPLVFIGLTRVGSRTSQAYILAAICALCLVWRFVLLLAFDATYDRISLGTDTRFDSILFGCILALVGNPVLDRSRYSIDLWKRVLLPLGLVGLLFSFIARNPVFDSTARYTLQGICLVPVFVVAIRCPEWFPVRPLNWRLSRSIGSISYPLYLVHPLVLALLINNFGVRSFASLGVGALVASILVSIGIYLGIEKPIGRLRRRLLTARTQPSSPAEASDTRLRPSTDVAAAASDS